MKRAIVLMLTAIILVACGTATVDDKPLLSGVQPSRVVEATATWLASIP